MTEVEPEEDRGRILQIISLFRTKRFEFWIDFLMSSVSFLIHYNAKNKLEQNMEMPI